MREAEALDAALALGKMYGATEGRIAALAGYIERQMGCALCLADGLEVLFERIERFPPPKQVLAVYREANESPRHAMHQGQSALVASVGKVEAFWHTDGAKVIQSHVGNHELALFIAAQMWWQRVPPDAQTVESEINCDTDIWFKGAQHFLAGVGGLTPELTQAAFHRARKAATEGDMAVTHDELFLVTA